MLVTKDNITEGRKVKFTEDGLAYQNKHNIYFIESHITLMTISYNQSYMDIGGSVYIEVVTHKGKGVYTTINCCISQKTKYGTPGYHLEYLPDYDIDEMEKNLEKLEKKLK